MRQHARDQVRTDHGRRGSAARHGLRWLQADHGVRGRFSRIPGMLGSPTRPPRRAPGRPRTAGTTGVPGAGPPLRLHLPEAERVQRERGARAGGPCLAGGEATAARATPPARSRTSRSTPDDWSAGEWHVTGEEARRAALMLASHAELCPFNRAGQITEVRVEPTLAVHDTDANVIVIAKPDLLYLEDGAWVWREIKTRQARCGQGPTCSGTSRSSRSRSCSGRERAGGQAGGHARRAGAALPRLRRHVLLIDPNDPAQVATAREVIHDLAAPWHADKTAAARPGRALRSAARSARWCPDGPPAWEREDRMTTPAHRRKPRTVPDGTHAAANGGDRPRAALPPAGARGPGVRGRGPARLQPPGPARHRSGSEPPASVPDMVTWAARTPLAQWPTLT